MSPACDNCYAELWSKRLGKKIWGAGAERRFFGDAHWKEPLAWNAEAADTEERPRVFCASMADVFEHKKGLAEHRRRLWDLIERTPNLDWLLLTKRPQNISRMVPWDEDSWPQNIWLGTTVENQQFARLRLPHLLKHRSVVRFLSCEPLLGEIDLSTWIDSVDFQPIDWIIAGGESGPGARPMHPDWVDSLRNQCIDSNIAFHFKQWGHWVPTELVERDNVKKVSIQWSGARSVEMTRLPKKDAGRMLGGRTWDEVPLVEDLVHG